MIRDIIMKRLALLCGLIVIVVTACTEYEIAEQISPTREEITVKAYTPANDTPQTKITSEYVAESKKYTFAWENDDTFSAIRGGENQIFTKANTGENDFTGTAPKGEGKCYAIHPATTATDYTQVPFDISNQSDDAAYVMYSATDDINTFGFEHAMAYLHFSLPAKLTGTTCDIMIFTPSGVYTEGKINLSNGTISYTNNSKNSITLKNRNANNPILVAIPPMSGNNKTLSFWVKSSNGSDVNYYKGTLAGNPENDIKAGKYYTANLTLTEAVPYVTFIAAGTQQVKYTGGDNLSYSTNGGQEWYPFGTDWVDFNGPILVKATTTNPNGTGSTQFKFNNSTEGVACIGDIRTLIDSENYKTVETKDAKFSSLFYQCENLTTAPELPAKALAENCYQNMFRECISLTAAPELPATTLAQYCYNNMFYGCTSLTTAPELPAITLEPYCYTSMFYGCTSLTTALKLHATTLANNSCNSMFYNCTSLTAAPELSATTLADNCYRYMFYGCTSLTTAPELPVTTLAESCYSNMFQNCTSLTTAPELPATTLAQYCYSKMFNGCTNLNYIKMLATDISANGCLSNWVKGVASKGTFVKHSSMTSLPKDANGINGIPSGWTVIDASN